MKTPTPSAATLADSRPLRVAAYARVSTLNQVLRADSSVDTQLAQIRLQAETEAKKAVHGATRPWRIIGEYREEGA